MTEMNDEELRRLFELLVKASKTPIFNPTEMMTVWAARDSVESHIKK
jgi:hypothetical protein